MRFPIAFRTFSRKITDIRDITVRTKNFDATSVRERIVTDSKLNNTNLHPWRIF
jgi:hypothetical protein